MARLIDTRAAANKIHEYMEDFPRAETRLATCRVILSMLGDENQIPTIEAVQHFCGGDICENRIGSSRIFAITSGEISPEDMPISCMIPEMDMLLRGPVVFCRRCGHELAAVYEDDLKAVKKSIVLPGGDWF